MKGIFRINHSKWVTFLAENMYDYIPTYNTYNVGPTYLYRKYPYNNHIIMHGYVCQLYLNWYIIDIASLNIYIHRTKNRMAYVVFNDNVGTYEKKPLYLYLFFYRPAHHNFPRAQVIFLISCFFSHFLCGCYRVGVHMHTILYFYVAYVLYIYSYNVYQKG